MKTEDKQDLVDEIALDLAEAVKLLQAAQKNAYLLMTGNGELTAYAIQNALILINEAATVNKL